LWFDLQRDVFFAGFVALSPGWPDDPESVAEANADPEALAGKSIGDVASCAHTNSGIRVNVIGPGAIHTEEYAPDGEEGKRRRGQTVPLGRVGYPEDIAGAVAFLASEKASFITGQTLSVSGGLTMA